MKTKNLVMALVAAGDLGRQIAADGRRQAAGCRAGGQGKLVIGDGFPAYGHRVGG